MSLLQAFTREGFDLTRHAQKQGCHGVTFRAKILFGGKTATGIDVPGKVVQHLGSGKRPDMALRRIERPAQQTGGTSFAEIEAPARLADQAGGVVGLRGDERSGQGGRDAARPGGSMECGERMAYPPRAMADVAGRRPIGFGYNPPTGDRLIERVAPATFVRDLGHVLDVASQAFDSFWVSDHHMTADRYRLECWTQLTWIAARYPGPLLGTVVLANSYRHPPLLAKMAASLQVFSHGRLILGYGAGWAEEEYRAYGYEFPPAKVRIAQMVDGIKVMRALWSGGNGQNGQRGQGGRPATYQGPYYRVTDAYCEPRPEPPPPIMIGGDGERYLLRAVAEHGDWWLPYARTTAVLRHKLDVLRDHCRAVGRDINTIRKAYTCVAYLDRHRQAAIDRAGARLEHAEQPAFAGDPAALRDYLAERIELGFDHFVLVFARFPETDDLELFVDEVLPAFR